MQKTVQVVLEDSLVIALDARKAKLGVNRSELVRQACWHFLRRAEEMEAERAYAEAYSRMPEGEEVGLAQIALLDDVLGSEER